MMNGREFMKMTDTMLDNAYSLLAPKGQDYASDTNRLSNFEHVSAIFNTLTGKSLTPYDVALLLQIGKLDRQNNLISAGKTPKNESMHDNLVDEINYILLKTACLTQAQQCTKQSQS